MMQFAARSRAELVAESQQRYRAAVAQAPPPDFRNVEAVQSLDALLHFTFRGRPYQAQPTPYADGVAFLRWRSRVEAMAGKSDPESLAEFEALLADAVARFGRLARPLRLRDRLRWLGRNPFAEATEAEVACLVGFFSTCRMIARVRHAGMN